MNLEDRPVSERGKGAGASEGLELAQGLKPQGLVPSTGQWFPFSCPSLIGASTTQVKKVCGDAAGVVTQTIS